jgi:hypothetical protein
MLADRVHGELLILAFGSPFWAPMPLPSAWRNFADPSKTHSYSRHIWFAALATLLGLGEVKAVDHLMQKARWHAALFVGNCA